MDASSRLRHGVIAGLIGVTMAVAVMAVSSVVLRAATQDSVASLQQARQAGVAGVGGSVADQVARALGYGIPLDALYGLDRYLSTVIEGSPSLDAAALLDTDGRVIQATADLSEGADFPVTINGETVAVVRLVPAPALLGPAIDRLWLALVATAALIGALGTLTSFLFLRRHHAIAFERLRHLFAEAIADRYPSFPVPAAAGSVALSLSAFDAALNPLRRAVRALNDAAATVRAIDFDGSLADRMTPMIAPAEGRIALVEPDRSMAAAWTAAPTAALWLLAGLAGLYATTISFISTFALDRQSGQLPPSLLPAMVILSEVVVGLLAVWIARRLPAIMRRPVAVGGLVVSGVATMLVYGTRDFETFVQYQALVAAGFGFAASALYGRSPGHLRVLVVPVVLAAILLIGPLAGGLLGEALGRQASFLAVGIGFLVAAVATSMFRPLERSPDTGFRRVPIACMLLSAALGTAIGSTLLVWVPLGPSHGDYLSGGLWIAATGLACTAIRVRSLLFGVVLTAGAMVALDFLPPSPLSQLTALALLGFGLRGLAESLERWAGGPALIGGCLGLVVGAVAIGLAEHMAVPALSAVAGLVVLQSVLGAALAARTDG